MSALTIHTHGFLKGDRDWRGIEPAIHEGTVREVASEIVAHMRTFGHDVTTAGGDYTGTDGEPVALWFRVTLARGDEPSMWHSFTTPGQQWGRV